MMFTVAEWQFTPVVVMERASSRNRAPSYTPPVVVALYPDAPACGSTCRPNTSANPPAGSSTPKTIDSADASPLAVKTIRLQFVPRVRSARLLPCSRVAATGCADRANALRQYTSPAGADNVWQMFCAPPPESVRCHALVPPAGSPIPPTTERNDCFAQARSSSLSLQAKRLAVGSRNVKLLSVPSVAAKNSCKAAASASVKPAYSNCHSVISAPGSASLIGLPSREVLTTVRKRRRF